MKTSRYQVFSSTGGTEYPVNPVLDPWPIQPYDFRDAENADRISESSYKNGIYSLTRNVTEFVKVYIYIYI